MVSLFKELKSIEIYLTRRLLHLRKAQVNLLYQEDITEYSKYRNTQFNLDEINPTAVIIQEPSLKLE